MGHFLFLLIKLKFQWAILSQFNIAISAVNGPFFCSPAPHYPNHCLRLLLSVIKGEVSPPFNYDNLRKNCKADISVLFHVSSLEISIDNRFAASHAGSQ